MGYYLIEKPIHNPMVSMIERAMKKYTDTYPDDPPDVVVSVKFPGLTLTITGKSGSITYPS